MLANLYIENIAVIEKTNIDFIKGLNVLTGETGAGKSIIIDSINMVLGKRSPRTLIRAGANSALVSATFDNISELVKRKLRQMGFSIEDDVLILQREMYVSGKNSCHINSRPASVSALKELGEYLINIHGQNDSLELMNSAYHILYIDALSDFAPILSEYRSIYKELKKTENELSSANSDDAERLQRVDILKFQIEELEAADVKIGEYDQLQNEKTALLNSERISKELTKSLMILEGDSYAEGVVSAIDSVSESLIFVSQYMNEVESLSNRFSSALYEIQDCAEEIRSYMNEIEASDAKLEEIEERLDLLYKLKKKYGSTEEEILEYLENARKELSELENYEVNRELLQNKYDELYSNANKLAQQLSKIRHDTAEQFVNQVEQEMAFLLMPNIKLVVDFEKIELSNRGNDKIEFLISVNPGEDPKPVAKIASGGELSRMMLAIKTVLSKSDFVETLIFDEIDTGISGSAAQRVGKKLSQLSGDRQVMCVTHQAQIASFADNHLLIKKRVESDRTFTSVSILDIDGRIRELARIIGGEEITDTALEHARRLIEDNK